jgi:threonine/homoserine/homoserine lactone efflux protein
MQLAYLLRGIALGFSIAAPVGPIGVLCIRRTLTEGKASGLATGLGAASADALYGTATALGLSLISGALVDHSAGLRLLGGAFLCYHGRQACLPITFQRQPGPTEILPHGPILDARQPHDYLLFCGDTRRDGGA